MKKSINVFSEYGKLKTVLLHRPGKEFSNLTPDLLERLLFDETPFLKVARQEHDYFAKLLHDNGVEVLYIETLLAETIDMNEKLKEEFVQKFLDEGKVNPAHRDALYQYFTNMNTQDMVNSMIAGVETRDIGVKNKNNYPFAIDPLPNTVFQRDPFASAGIGVTLHRMFSETRRRETLFCHYVLHHHPRFANQIKFYYHRDEDTNLEGGDVMVLNKETLVIGKSQRTELKSIEKVAKRVLHDADTSFKKVYCLDLPESRAFMHLDTVFTSIDFNKFIVHPLIFDFKDQFKVWEITAEGKKLTDHNLETLFTEINGSQPTFIRCGGDSPITQAQEQWNDGTNVLAIAPGKVIAYDRNPVTVSLLKKAGVEVLEMPSSELSRGRGGPRCMSMPIVREDI